MQCQRIAVGHQLYRHRIDLRALSRNRHRRFGFIRFFLIRHTRTDGYVPVDSSGKRQSSVRAGHGMHTHGIHRPRNLFQIGHFRAVGQRERRIYGHGLPVGGDVRRAKRQDRRIRFGFVCQEVERIGEKNIRDLQGSGFTHDHMPVLQNALIARIVKQRQNLVFVSTGVAGRKIRIDRFVLVACGVAGCGEIIHNIAVIAVAFVFVLKHHIRILLTRDFFGRRRKFHIAGIGGRCTPFAVGAVKNTGVRRNAHKRKRRGIRFGI